MPNDSRALACVHISTAFANLIKAFIAGRLFYETKGKPFECDTVINSFTFHIRKISPRYANGISNIADFLVWSMIDCVRVCECMCVRVRVRVLSISNHEKP